MSRRSIDIDDELWQKVRTDAIAEGISTRALVARRLGGGPSKSVSDVSANVSFTPAPKPTRKGCK